MKKRSQMEIMGLAIVIVLMTLGVLFVVRFGILKPQTSEIKASYTETQLAANMLNAILKSTSDFCYGHDIQSLLQDCGSTPSGFEPSITCQDNKDSCEYAWTVINSVLTDTLKEWRRDYEFTACVWDYDPTVQDCRDLDKLDDLGYDIPIHINQSYCYGDRERKSVPLHTEIGELVVRLDICSN